MIRISTSLYFPSLSKQKKVIFSLLIFDFLDLLLFSLGHVPSTHHDEGAIENSHHQGHENHHENNTTVGEVRVTFSESPLKDTESPSPAEDRCVYEYTSDENDEDTIEYLSKPDNRLQAYAG